MGVMRCDRNHCENILCDRLILGGKMYICRDCYHELCAYKTTWSTAEMVVPDVRARIVEFMKTEPGTYTAAQDIEAEFNKLVG